MTLLNDVVRHERTFYDFIHAVSRGDNKNAAQSARTLLNGLRETLAEIQTSYADSLIQAQMPSFLVDIVRLKAETPPDTRDLSELARRMERYLAVVEREVRRLRKPEPPVWRQSMIRWKSELRTAGLVIGGLAVILLVGHWLFSRGHGLVGHYYDGTDFSVPYRRRLDSKIDFMWGRQSPIRGWRRDRFSIRWVGYLLAPTAGRYQFYLHVDDGARLFIDDQSVIDDWRVHKLHAVHGETDLTAGYHAIRLEYFDQTKDADIRLFWQRPNDPRPGIVSTRFLFPSKRSLKSEVQVFESTTSTEEMDISSGDEEEGESAPPSKSRDGADDTEGAPGR